MNQRQRAFCEAYLLSGNATEAAIKAGYSPKSARSIGQRLLTYVDIREYAQAKQKGGRSVTTSILYPPGGSFVFPFIDPPTMRPRLAGLI